MTELLSHPDLKLREHVTQVHAVADALWSTHSTPFRDRLLDVHTWLSAAVCLHDAGKGSAAFQQYIPAPRRWRGRSIEKRHAPLSMLCALTIAEQGQWAWHESLAVAASVAGHHAGWHTGDGLENVLAGDNEAVLRVQVDTVPWGELSAALDTDLPALVGTEDLVDPALDLLEMSLDELRRLPLEDGVAYRLRTQLCLSLLLEADKAFLAIKPDFRDHYPFRGRASLEPELVDCFLRTKSSTPLDPMRKCAREMMLSALDCAGEARVHTVTLPTGAGKTLLAASWALRLREQLREDQHTPKIIIVLPYLSIIDQTQDEYHKLLGDGCTPQLLMQSHSLADRVFDTEMDGDANDFFLDTWQSDIVITTFDQFLFALLSSDARHLMRFHNLCDALIVMDEVQTLPCRLWDPLSHAIDQLTRLGNAHILAMSATQPGFLSASCDLTPDKTELFSGLGRYGMKLNHRHPVRLDEFTAMIVRRASAWQDKRVLLTFNTRRSARTVRDALAAAAVAPLYFITADVTPGDRLESIEKSKRNQPCIVVSTQCIEAGVDIDMDFVIRDFAPLDSLIQVAGRCNRNAWKARCTVEIVNLVNDNGRSFTHMIYDEVLLQATRQVLGGEETVGEESVLSLAEAYFEILRRERNLGEEFTAQWARWEDTEAVRKLLRGDTRQVTFVVVERDLELVDLLEQAAVIEDRWEKRRAIRGLAGRIARISVSVYANKRLDPEDYARLDPTGNFYLLKPGYYQPETGLQLARPETEESWGWLL